MLPHGSPKTGLFWSRQIPPGGWVWFVRKLKNTLTATPRAVTYRHLVHFAATTLVAKI